ncbi:hypothetical protein [Enterobacter mori]
MAAGVPFRAYLLGVGTEVNSFGGKAQQSATSEEMLTFDDLHFTASINFDADKTRSSSDDTTLEIYNLNPQTREAFHQHGATVILRAGYDTEWQRDGSGAPIPDYESLPVVYLGTVIQAIDKKDAGGLNRITKVWLSTDKLERATTKHVQDFKPGTKRRDVVEALVKKMKLPVIRMELDSLGERTYPAGLTLSGRVADDLTKVCRENGLQWSVHNKAISVLRSDNQPKDTGNKDAEAWLLTPDQILQLEGYYERKSQLDDGKGTAKSHRMKKTKAKTPKPQAEDTKVTKANGIKTKTRQGVNVTTFLNGEVKIHDLVKIEGMDDYLPEDDTGRASDGLYRVINISHDMDYLQGNWQTALKLVPINA